MCKVSVTQPGRIGRAVSGGVVLLYEVRLPPAQLGPHPAAARRFGDAEADAALTLEAAEQDSGAVDAFAHPSTHSSRTLLPVASRRPRGR